MGIRQAAAEKLVRQLLELRLTRVIQLSDEFIATMAKMVRAFVDMDEQHQRAETIINQCDGCRRGLPIENGLHIREDGLPDMACTKERYTAALEREEKP